MIENDWKWLSRKLEIGRRQKKLLKPLNMIILWWKWFLTFWNRFCYRIWLITSFASLFVRLFFLLRYCIRFNSTRFFICKFRLSLLVSFLQLHYQLCILFCSVSVQWLTRFSANNFGCLLVALMCYPTCLLFVSYFNESSQPHGMIRNLHNQRCSEVIETSLN